LNEFSNYFKNDKFIYIKFYLNAEIVTMQLKLNEKLTKSSSIIETFKSTDKNVINMSYLNRTKHECYFNGIVLNHYKSFVGISLCNNMVKHVLLD